MTSTTGRAALSAIVGEVEAANERGIKLGGTWHAFSRFADAGAFDQGLRPGEYVRLALDRQGFIRRIEAVEASAGAPALTSAPTSGAPDPITLRLRALEIAANCVGRFAECREQVRTADVFLLADKLLAWVLDSSPRQDRADLAR